MKRLVIVLICVATLHARAQFVTKVDAVGITVSDLDAAVKFYTEVLTFEKISETEMYGSEVERLKGAFGIRYKKARLRLGEEEIELTDYLTSGGRAVPEDSRSNDLWFQHLAIVVTDMDAAYARLRKFNVAHVSTAPQTLPPSIPAAAGVKAFYFRDIDGHNLELIWFPKDKGNPRWQQVHGKLFAGIDHTAIAVSATTQSKAFYETLLGVKYQGESFNLGEQQEHLNNVEGASLHISGNRATAGIGVEFLEYLHPVNGRPYPTDERADDLIHYETIMITDDAAGLFEKLKNHNIRLVSSSAGPVALKGDYRVGFYVRDPDGHVIGIFQR